MMRFLTICLFVLTPLGAAAQSASDLVDVAVNEHVLPRYARLVTEAETLAAVAQDHCEPGDAMLETAFHDAFDAWIGVSHFTFGPAEVDGRYYNLAFWPDSRGLTGRNLGRLITEQDPIVEDAVAFTEESVAARGLYALEFLLFDPQISGAGDVGYHCALVQAVATDIAATTHLIHDDWVNVFADLMLNAGENDRFQSPEEALRVLFGSVVTGLEFTADLRLGRPLGSFDAPRPTRAEARRSGRSLRHVALSLEALEDLAMILAAADPDIAGTVSAAFAEASARVELQADDPAFAGVADAQGRFRVEVLQNRVRDVQAVVSNELGPSLGVAAGFNSLDGD